MSKIKFDVNVDNGVAIDVANDDCTSGLVDGGIPNQNHFYIPKLNDINIPRQL